MVDKQLVLLRHAKSSWADEDLADRDRPLNARGRGAASLVGAYLREAGWHPDLVLCSSARRTCQTLELLGVAAGTDVVIEDRLYGAASGELLGRLHMVPAAVMSVLLIGHNPGVEELAAVLVDDEAGFAERFPTAALAWFDVPTTAWDELDPGGGRLRAFVIPEDLVRRSRAAPPR